MEIRFWRRQKIKTSRRISIINLLAFHESHLSSRLIVVQVHLAASVAFDLSYVQKLASESNAEINVNRAASPLPRLFERKENSKVRLKDKRVERCLLRSLHTHLILIILILTTMNLVAAARRNVPPTAGCRDCVNNACVSDCISERSFFWACDGKKVESNFTHSSFIVNRRNYGGEFLVIFARIKHERDVIMAQMSLSAAIMIPACDELDVLSFSRNTWSGWEWKSSKQRRWREKQTHIDESQIRVFCYQQTINNGVWCCSYLEAARLKPRDDLRASDQWRRSLISRRLLCDYLFLVFGVVSAKICIRFIVIKPLKTNCRIARLVVKSTINPVYDFKLGQHDTLVYLAINYAIMKILMWSPTFAKVVDVPASKHNSISFCVWKYLSAAGSTKTWNIDGLLWSINNMQKHRNDLWRNFSSNLNILQT